MENEINKLFEEIQDTCGVLSISHDAPDIETIKEWFEKYEQLKKQLQNGKTKNNN